MSRKILWINPIGVTDYDQALEEWLNASKEPETEIKVISLSRGPHHLEYYYYDALVTLDVLHAVRRAEMNGFDAAIIGCFYDPGLREAREITERMAITALEEASLLTAAALGRLFSIVVGRKKFIPKMEENVVRYGLHDRLASLESLEMGVEDFQRQKEETARRIQSAGEKAIKEHLAEVLILGCGFQFGFYLELQKKLRIPVVDPVIAALKQAELLATLRQRFGWGHSKVYEYESPRKEEMTRWNLPAQYEGMEGAW